MRVLDLSDHVADSIEEVPDHLGEGVACGNVVARIYGRGWRVFFCIFPFTGKSAETDSQQIVAAAIQSIMPRPGPFRLPG